jgi:hypothetical protein
MGGRLEMEEMGKGRGKGKSRLRAV